MELLSLPDEALSVIAAHLKPDIRLTSFSLAHSRLRAAADHANKTQLSFSHTFRLHSSRDHAMKDEWWEMFDVTGKGDPRAAPDYRRKCCNHFANWLVEHGQCLTRLQLTNFNMQLFSPLPALKELELYGCGALWHDDDNFGCYRQIFAADIPDAVTSLTKLDMGICTWYTETYQQIAALTNLQHFTFSSPTRADNGWHYGCRGPPHDLEFGYTHEPYLDSAFFKTLTNLTHLELRISTGATGKPVLTIDGAEEHKNAVQHLSCLVKLQALIITNNSISPQLAEGLSGLRNMTALTRLHLAPVSKYTGWQPAGTM